MLIIEKELLIHSQSAVSVFLFMGILCIMFSVGIGFSLHGIDSF